MKKLLLILPFFFSLISFDIKCQRFIDVDKLNYEIIYQLNYKEDSTDTDLVKQEKMTLLIGDSTSLFMSYALFLKDSTYFANRIWEAPSETKIKIAMQVPKPVFAYRIFKTRATNQLSFRETFLVDTFEYPESMVLDWLIQDEFKVILGYKCQKATVAYGGRAYEAWFSVEIPVSDGPYKFKGLPGLILSIKDLKNHYHFEAIGISSKKGGYIKTPKARLLILTKDKFREKERQYRQNPFQMLEQMGNSMTLSGGGTAMTAQEMDKGVNDELKKKNNPIELK
jgi:GLPGLI family protein